MNDDAFPGMKLLDRLLSDSFEGNDSRPTAGDPQGLLHSHKLTLTLTLICTFTRPLRKNEQARHPPKRANDRKSFLT